MLKLQTAASLKVRYVLIRYDLSTKRVIGLMTKESIYKCFHIIVTHFKFSLQMCESCVKTFIDRPWSEAAKAP